MLDGLPRNLHQAELLKDYVTILHVIYLVCNDQEEMIHRIKRRAIRENRTDDANEDIIRHRYKVYHADTAPVVDFYDKSQVHEVEAMGSPAEVLSRILKVLILVQNSHYQNNSNGVTTLKCNYTRPEVLLLRQVLQRVVGSVVK
ncbi:MAG: nucleoside monophosphate kinase [Planctomycetaceae bacterium]